ncbi:MAG TPA: TIGR03936 family radical SAM-associated protein [Dehalococcoidales bacterium]|nr:TIGR03936 family radical SAM-associated protein [Dehalococcoidales bacterium]
MQRLRIRFTRGEEIKYISHLDLLRLWQRALARAGIAIAYSEGFSPHPRMSLAAPLALGVTGESELLDIYLAKWSSPHTFTAAMERQLPIGLKIEQVFNIAPTMPSLQSQVTSAEYRVSIATEKTQTEVESAINALLDKETLPWQHQRDTGTRHYDLRALIEDIWLESWRSGSCEIMMRLRCDSAGSGRPEQVIAAMGFEKYPESIHRVRLILRTQ